jgi:hypothetical protein
MTESDLFTIRIISLPCRHAEFISVSGFVEQEQILKQVQDDGKWFVYYSHFSLPCRHTEFISVSGLRRTSTDPKASSG